MATKALFSIIMATLFLASTAEAVVLCAKPRSGGSYNTSVKLREARETGATQLDPAALGLQGDPGLPGTVQLNFQAYRDPNDKVTGGGVYSTNFTEVEEYYHYPLYTLEGWAVSGLFTGDAPVTITLYAICADLPDPPA